MTITTRIVNGRDASTSPTITESHGPWIVLDERGRQIWPAAAQDFSRKPETVVIEPPDPLDLFDVPYLNRHERRRAAALKRRGGR